MKFKADFVTNSSSASFILYITFISDDFDRFKEAWENFIKKFEKEYYQTHKFADNNIKIFHIRKNLFTIEQWTSAYNFLSDIPNWMKYVIIFQNIYPDLLLDFGFINIKLEIVENP